MTGTNSFFQLFAVLFFLVSNMNAASVKVQSPDTVQQPGVKFTGLTQTLANLLKTRIVESFVIGAYEIPLEELIDDDIAAVFNCDSVISRYLAEAGDEATYGMLSNEMSHAIESHFVYDDGYLYVNTFSDTTAEGMYFNISIARGKPITLPILLQASDSSFSTSFDTTLTAIFNANIDLFMNASQAIADSQSRAIRVRINEFTFEVTSKGDENYFYNDCSENESEESDDYSPFIEKRPKCIPFEIKGKSYCAAPKCFSLYAKTFWYLCPADAENSVVEDGVSYTLSYEQIEKGDFIWDESYLSSVSMDLVMLPVDEEWDSLPYSENRAEFQYVVDDLFDPVSPEQIALCCDFSIREDIIIRDKRHVFKP